ncbi:MAG: sulfite exporter TauE/SafE family protein [Rhodospirillales bacterium]|nr:sulfite exporter TauE/SafE family protein [Rhodospirillales bacterium]
MDSVFITTAIGAFLAAGCVKGVIGLGLPLTSIAILTTTIGLRDAIPLIVIPVLITNIWQASQGGALAQHFRRFWSLNLLLCAGTWGGTVMLFRIDPWILTLVLGVVIICYALINMFAVTMTVRKGSEVWLSPSVGAFSGLLTGLTGSVGAPVAIYLQALGLGKEEFLQAISLSFFLAAVAWIPSLASQSAFDLDIALKSSMALIPAFAGMWVGQRIRGYLSELYFRRGVFLFLIIVGANLIRRAVL